MAAELLLLLLKKMVMFIVIGLILLSPRTEAARTGITRQKLEVQKHLKRLNKPPLKTIKSPDGDTIDCVHMSHQPAFDHPFLKNHTIQMRPSYHPEGLFDERKEEVSSKPKEIAQLWHLNGKCPEGTIPIRRTKKDDVLRASSVKRFGRKKHRTIPKPRSADPDLINQSGHQHAIAYVQGDKYYGAKATINVWEPKIQQPNEFSLSQIWILGGSFGEDLNSIEAGWQVSPDLYGDNNTRLFTYWTSDAYQATGCYNLLCSGFIQINSQIAMGASIFPVSGYRGSQYDISILVWKDPKEGHWWMQFGNGYVLGYWPSFLFSYLGESASMVEWGGEVVTLNQMENILPLKWVVVNSLKKVLQRQVILGIFRLLIPPTISSPLKELALLQNNPIAMMFNMTVMVIGATTFTMVDLEKILIAHSSPNYPPLLPSFLPNVSFNVL